MKKVTAIFYNFLINYYTYKKIFFDFKMYNFTISSISGDFLVESLFTNAIFFF